MKMFAVTRSPANALAVDTFVIHQGTDGMKAKEVPRSLLTVVIAQSARKSPRRFH